MNGFDKNTISKTVGHEAIGFVGQHPVSVDKLSLPFPTGTTVVKRCGRQPYSLKEPLKKLDRNYARVGVDSFFHTYPMKKGIQAKSRSETPLLAASIIPLGGAK